MTLDMPVLDDIDNDDDINAANDMPKEQPRRSKSGIFLAAVLFAVVLFAGAGAVYYFLNGRNFEHDIIQFDAGNIDVFKLAAYGSPKQLKEAVKHGAIFNVEWNMLDTHGADTEESIFESGETPLHRAASLNRNPESIKFLISQGLDVNAWATAGTMLAGTPLYCAVVHGNTEAARELLKAGADPNAYSSSGNMLQILACSDNNPSSKSIAELLIKYGANVNGHNETDRKRNMIKPRSSWTSEKPFENILDDVYDGDVRVFIASSVPLTLAVLYDNSEMVGWLLDEKADPNISNIEGRIALHYAEEFPDDSKMKRSKAFRRLKAATEKSIKQNVTSAKDYESAKYLNDLLALKKVPDYIRNKGSFFCNPDFLKSGGVVEIKNAGGANVNMRSQPNMQARIIAQLNENSPADFPMYAGEWTNLNGERWIMTQYFDDSTKDIETAWIFGKYTGIMTGEEYAVLLDGIVESEAESGVENDSLIDAVRNNMYYSSYPREAGYLPVGQQCERVFSNYTWRTEKTDDERYGNKCAVFRGIGTAQNGRRFVMEITFVKDASKGQLLIEKAEINGSRIYSYSVDYLNRMGMGGFLQGLNYLAGGLSNMGANAPNSNMFQNQLSLDDFLGFIYL